MSFLKNTVELGISCEIPILCIALFNCYSLGTLSTQGHWAWTSSVFPVSNKSSLWNYNQLPYVKDQCYPMRKIKTTHTHTKTVIMSFFVPEHRKQCLIAYTWSFGRVWVPTYHLLAKSFISSNIGPSCFIIFQD